MYRSLGWGDEAIPVLAASIAYIRKYKLVPTKEEASRSNGMLDLDFNQGNNFSVEGVKRMREAAGDDLMLTIQPKKEV